MWGVGKRGFHVLEDTIHTVSRPRTTLETFSKGDKPHFLTLAAPFDLQVDLRTAYDTRGHLASGDLCRRGRGSAGDTSRKLLELAHRSSGSRQVKYGGKGGVSEWCPLALCACRDLRQRQVFFAGEDGEGQGDVWYQQGS